MAKSHIYKLKMFGWRLYFTNVKMKKMSSVGVRRSAHHTAMQTFKRRRFKINGGTCDLCGKRLKFDDVQLHHILPYSEFPQYGVNPKNMEIVCEDCHHAIHLNPYANLKRMEVKAREFGFDLITYFEGKKN